jgi:hypothetical protein
MPWQAGRQQVVLDGAGQHRVGRLLGAEPSVAAAVGGPLGLDDLRGGDLRRAERADLARPHEVGQRAEGLVDIGVRIGNAHLVEVDPVGPQPTQRPLDRFGEPPPRRSDEPGVRIAERDAGLHGEHRAVAPSAGQRLAQDLLRLAAGVAVGGVDEVDPGVQRCVDDLDRFVVIGVAERAEHHRAQAHLADRDAGAPQGPVFHGKSLPPAVAG